MRSEGASEWAEWREGSGAFYRRGEMAQGLRDKPHPERNGAGGCRSMSACSIPSGASGRLGTRRPSGWVPFSVRTAASERGESRRASEAGNMPASALGLNGQWLADCHAPGPNQVSVQAVATS